MFDTRQLSLDVRQSGANVPDGILETGAVPLTSDEVARCGPQRLSEVDICESSEG